MALFAFPNKAASPVAHLLEATQRQKTVRVATHAPTHTHSRAHTCTRVLRPHPHAPTLHATSRLFHILFWFLTCISPPRLFQPLNSNAFNVKMSQNYANIFCKILYIIMVLFCLFVCFAFTGLRVESDHTCKPIPGHGAEGACVAQTDGVGAGFAEQGGGIVSSVGPRRQPYCSAGERESCCIGLFVMNRDPKKILYFIFFIIIVVNIIILCKTKHFLIIRLLSSYHVNTFLIIVLHCFSCIVHCIVYKTCNDKNALCRFLDPAVRDEQPWQSSKYVYVLLLLFKKTIKIEN